MDLSGGARLSSIISREGPFLLLVVGKVEVEIQAGIGIDSLLLKGKPPRNPLIRCLSPQSSNNFVPLSHQRYLLMKIPMQPVTLLIQASHRADCLGSLATSLVQLRRLVTKIVFDCTQLFLKLPKFALGREKLVPDHLKFILGGLQPVPNLHQVVLYSPQFTPSLLKLTFSRPQAIPGLVFPTLGPDTSRSGMFQI